MEKLYIFSETSHSMADIGRITTIAGNWETSSIDIYKNRCKWIGKRYLKDGCRFQIVSESQLFPDYDNYGWDYSNPDGFGSASFYTQSWDDYLKENELI